MENPNDNNQVRNIYQVEMVTSVPFLHLFGLINKRPHLNLFNEEYPIDSFDNNDNLHDLIPHHFDIFDDDDEVPELVPWPPGPISY